MLRQEDLDAIEIAGIESLGGGEDVASRDRETVSTKAADLVPVSPQRMWAATVARLSAQEEQRQDYEEVSDEAVAASTLSRAGEEVPTRRVRSDAVSDDDFERLRVLGVGSFGRVVLSKHRGSGKLYALKLIAFSRLTQPKHLNRTKTERDVLAHVEHKNVVELHYAYRTARHLALVFEYCPGGELFHHLCKQRCLQASAVAFYAAELTLALDCVHSRGVVYRDVKPENCLLDARGHLKLADFGLAKAGVFEPYSGAHSVCGTVEYMAPDVLVKRPSGYGLAVDWWGLGVWTYELLTGLPPFYGSDRPKLFKRIREGPLKIPPYVPLPAAAFLATTLKRHPRHRLYGLDQAKRLPFFALIDFDRLSESIPPIRPCRDGKRATDRIGLENFDAKFAALDVREPPAPACRLPAQGDRNILANWNYIRPDLA